MTFGPQIKRGLILSLVLGLVLLSTALIPHLKQIPVVKRTDVRPAQAPAAVQVAPRIVSGDLSIVNYVHRSISVNGVAADQAYRVFAAFVFLTFYGLRILSSNRLVRNVLAAFALLGAAGCLSDVISYWVLDGVVDWIGVSGRSAFSPSDVCWCLAPSGVLLAVLSGMFTFRDDATARSSR